jgi:hypothetical protein
MISVLKDERGAAETFCCQAEIMGHPDKPGDDDQVWVGR